jgi:hypothetical protein
MNSHTSRIPRSAVAVKPYAVTGGVSPDTAISLEGLSSADRNKLIDLIVEFRAGKITRSKFDCSLSLTCYNRIRDQVYAMMDYESINRKIAETHAEISEIQQSTAEAIEGTFVSGAEEIHKLYDYLDSREPKSAVIDSETVNVHRKVAHILERQTQIRKNIRLDADNRLRELTFRLEDLEAWVKVLQEARNA